MQRWEYMRMRTEALESRDATTRHKSAKEVERYGKEGWELVSVSDGTMYFKRPILDVSKPEIPKLDRIVAKTHRKDPVAVLDRVYEALSAYFTRSESDLLTSDLEFVESLVKALRAASGEKTEPNETMEEYLIRIGRVLELSRVFVRNKNVPSDPELRG